MRQFVADNVHRNGESIEELPVAIAIDHLFTVPEGVVEVLAIMHRGIQSHAAIIDRVSLELLPVEIIGHARAVVSLVHFLVF